MNDLMTDLVDWDKTDKLQAKLRRVQNSFLDLTAEANGKEDVISKHVAEIQRLKETISSYSIAITEITHHGGVMMYIQKEDIGLWKRIQALKESEGK